MGIFPGHPLHSREEAAGEQAIWLCFSWLPFQYPAKARPAARSRDAEKPPLLTRIGFDILRRMSPNHSSSARVSKPLSFVAVLLSAFVLVNAFVVGCGGGGGAASDGASTTDMGADHGATDGGATPGTTTSSDPKIAMGAAQYSEKCALCHGATGHGDGVGAAALDPKPRNHTDGSYMNAQSNEALMAVIKDGKGQMPAWGATMSDEEVTAVLAYVRTLAEPAYTGPTP
jgi:mono/diheme cytochrome c family protein